MLKIVRNILWIIVSIVVCPIIALICVIWALVMLAYDEIRSLFVELQQESDMRRKVEEILRFLGLIVFGAFILPLILLFYAIHRLYIVIKVRLFAPPVPTAPLIECEWIYDSGLIFHAFLDDVFDIKEHIRGKIVRRGDVAVITTSYTDKWPNSEPVEAATYEVPLSTLDDIKAIFSRAHMNAWPKMPMKIFDRPSGSIHGSFHTRMSLSFTFDGEGSDDDRRFTFSDEQALPHKGLKAVDEIRKILRVREPLELSILKN